MESRLYVYHHWQQDIQLAASLGSEKSHALAMFQAPTGCDTASALNLLDMDRKLHGMPAMELIARARYTVCALTDIQEHKRAALTMHCIIEVTLLDEMHGFVGQVWGSNMQQVVGRIVQYTVSWKQTAITPLPSVVQAFAAIGRVSLCVFTLCVFTLKAAQPLGLLSYSLSCQLGLGVSCTLFKACLFQQLLSLFSPPAISHTSQGIPLPSFCVLVCPPKISPGCLSTFSELEFGSENFSPLWRVYLIHGMDWWNGISAN